MLKPSNGRPQHRRHAGTRRDTELHRLVAAYRDECSRYHELTGQTDSYGISLVAAELTGRRLEDLRRDILRYLDRPGAACSPAFETPSSTATPEAVPWRRKGHDAAKAPAE